MPSAELAACTRPHIRARHHVVLGLRPDAAEVGRVRRELRGCLDAWQVADAAAGSVLLVVSELAGNAVRHAPGPGIEVAVTAGYGEVLVEVRDGSSRAPVVRPGDGLYAEGGRGLTLVAALSRAWGWHPNSDGTKTTWALLPATTEGPA